MLALDCQLETELEFSASGTFGACACCQSYGSGEDEASSLGFPATCESVATDSSAKIEVELICRSRHLGSGSSRSSVEAAVAVVVSLRQSRFS